ncbi:glutamine amidotransferase [Arthrobacter sp. Soc17.1.1.1]|uniref:glutamine amidotransferase n=1 Tax=Arthrobacter sp. Soc17.1.1.1 TaxID=3121277 RepID=UPI002FE46DDD
MKPFLLLGTRAENYAADAEYRSFLRFGGLAEGELRRIRLEAEPLPALDLADYSGIFLGGSPFNSSDPQESKSGVQVRVEQELGRLLDRVVAEDHPFLGACYGVGTLGRHQGAVIDSTYAESVGTVEVTLTADGAADPLLAGLPSSFAAYVGHKEACATVPASAVLLASSATCPVQMFRVGRNVYATQFHPELDVEALVGRIDTYRHAGYFPPEEADEYMARARATVVDQPELILRAFVTRYARD